MVVRAFIEDPNSGAVILPSAPAPTSSGTSAPAPTSSGPSASSPGALVAASTVAGIRSAQYSGGVAQYEIPVTGKAGAAVRFPALPVPPGSTVDVVALPSNTQIVFVAQGLSEVQNGPRVPLSGTSNPRQYNITNLAQLFLLVQVDGEGVMATIRKGR